MDKILFLTTELPYPLDSGGKIRTYNMLEGLSEKFDIDIICFSEKENINYEIEKLNDICADIKVVKKIYTNKSSKMSLIKNVLKSIILNKPFIITKFSDKSYKNIVNEKVKSNKYSKIIVDHLQVAQFINDNLMKKAILSEHNCEYLILKRMYEETNNIIKKIYLKYEYKKLKKYEKKVCKQINKVILLSEDDKKALVDSNYNGENVYLIPISVDTEYVKIRKNEKTRKKNILFMGTMSWFPNEQGILWFLENVWGKLQKDGYKLYIVGKNPSNEIIKYRSSSVIVTGYVDDINEYIEKCDFCIVPLFIGGGMRVKILESMAKKIPTVSTAIGAEGINVKDGIDILIANTPNEFIAKIKELDNDELYNNIIENAAKIIDEKYSIKSVNEQIIKCLFE